jgi:hypothetical protein
MKTLPIAGAQLLKLRFWGNGKDSEATIEVKGARASLIPLSGAPMDLTFAGPITISTSSHDDAEVVIEIAPTSECPMILDDIAIQFPGNDDEWAECLRYYNEAGTLTECVNRLRLSARPMC